MRTWNDKLYLDAMPGRRTPIDNWITEIAHRLTEGFHVFVHCGAGVGRSGTFAVAVLMMMGKTVEEATQEITQIRSWPETDEQKALLEAGPT